MKKITQIFKKKFCLHDWHMELSEIVWQLGVSGRKERVGTNRVYICKKCGEFKEYHY